jgi:hypothetical protein
VWVPVTLSLPLTWCFLLDQGRAGSASGCAVADPRLVAAIVDRVAIMRRMIAHPEAQGRPWPTYRGEDRVWL